MLHAPLGCIQIKIAMKTQLTNPRRTFMRIPGASLRTTGLFCLLSLLLMASTVKAETEKPVKSKIKEVTVFLKGAQITRTAKVSLSTGVNEILFKGLGTGIDKNSIQATAPPEVLINSVVHEVNYLQETQKSPRIKVLVDSLDIVSQLIITETNELKVLDEEQKMILANKVLSGKEKGVTVEELRKAAAFFRERLREISGMKQKANRKITKLQLETSRINAQLQELNYKMKQPSNDIRVSIRVSRATTATLAIRYRVTNAGWAPRYDLRADDTAGPITLEYRADVFQNTGVDWSKIPLTLSASNPRQGGTKPTISPWNLFVQYATTRGGVKYDYKKSASAPSVANKGADMEAEDDYDEATVEAYEFGEASNLSLYTTMVEGATTARFEIKIPQSIPSDGKQHQVSIQRTKLPATYEHFAIPKLDPNAFLVARVTDWESLNLLPGKVAIFFEGTYLSESYISPSSTQDTLDFSLGRDKKVVITREQLKDYNQTKFIGSNRIRTYGFEIKIRNTKKSAIKLRLADQIPISQDKDITIKLEEKSKARLNQDTGKLVWDLELAPQETKTLKLVFSVKYPKNKPVRGL